MYKSNSMSTTPITIERTLNAPVDLIWQAITDKERMKEWYFDLKEFIPKIGFEFRFFGGPQDGVQYEHVCVVTQVVQHQKLTYSWRYEGFTGISYVTFDLFPDGDKTRAKLTHAGLETFPADNPDFAKENFVKGWSHIIGTSLKDFIEM